MTITNALNWTGGTMSGGGRTIIQNGATLNLAPPSSVSLSSRTLENGGTVLWTGAGGIILGTAVITNRAGALFHAQNAVSPFFAGGACRFDNAGTFRKSVNAGTMTIPSGVSFNSSGTVEIQTGTLQLAGGGSATGAFTGTAAIPVEWTSGAFTLNSGAQLNGVGLYKINGGTVAGDADLRVENLDLIAGTLDGAGAMTVAATMNWTGGTMSGSGRTIIAAGATLNLSSASALPLSRTLENGGTVFWTGAANVHLGVITNRAGALFEVRNAAALDTFPGSPRFDNAGTFRKSVNAGTSTIVVNFTNYGTVEIQTGALLCSGSFANNGAVNLSVGTTHRLAGDGSASGTFTVPATAMVEWTRIFSPGFVLNAGAQLNGAGLYRINNGLVTANTTLVVENLDLIAGELNSTATLSIATTMNWMGGTMSGRGRTIISPNAMLNVANPKEVNLSGLTLENGGTVLWTGAGRIILSTVIITNRVGALFHVPNAAPLSVFSGPNRFDNTGTFRKSVDPGTTTFPGSVSFNNSGTVDLRSGILAANGGYVSSANALLKCALGGTVTGTNYGQLQVAGTVNLNGALGVDFVNGFSPAINDSFTLLTAGTRNGSFSQFLHPANVITMQLRNTATSVIALVTDVAAPLMLFKPKLSGTTITLTWTALSNTTCQVEFNADLNPSNWLALTGDVTSLSNIASKVDLLTPSNRMYRVRVVP